MVDFADLALRADYSQIDKATAALDRLKAAGAGAEQSTSKVGVSSVAATRNMGAWAAIQAEAAGHVGEHSLSISRLERNLASASERMLGVNSVLGLLGSSFLKFGVGDIYTVAILGGIYAVVKAYDLLADGARKVREEQEKLTQALANRFAPKTGTGSAVMNEYDAALAEQKDAALHLRILRGATGPFADLKIAAAYGALGEQAPFLSRQKLIDQETERLGNANRAIGRAQANGAGILSTLTTNSEERRNESEARRIAEARDRARAETASQRDAGGWQHELQRREAAQLSLVPDRTQIPLTGQLTDAQMKLVGSIIKLDEQYDAAKKVFSSTTAVVDDFKKGLKEAVTGLLEQFSPSNIVQNLAGGLVSQVDHLVSGVLSNAIGGVRHAIFGQDAAERQASREQARAAEAATLQLDALAQSLAHNNIGAMIDQLRASLISTLSAIDAAMPGKKYESERNAARARAAELEAQQEAQAQHQNDLNRRYAQEDLAVRNLRATGQGDAADRLAFQEQQQREMQKAIDEGRDATYLNTLATTQNNELLAYQNGLLATAFRNAPTGFFANSYYSQFASPRGADPFGTGLPSPNSPAGTGAAIGSGLKPPGSRGGTQTINVVLPNGKVLASVMIGEIDQYASATGGGGSSRSAAMDRYPLS